MKCTLQSVAFYLRLKIVFTLESLRRVKMLYVRRGSITTMLMAVITVVESAISGRLEELFVEEIA
nr:hypothetical protein [uncultured Pseudodesulfovibrio sp.]